jgi:stage II sporulation protein D
VRTPSIRSVANAIVPIVVFTACTSVTPSPAPEEPRSRSSATATGAPAPSQTGTTAATDSTGSTGPTGAGADAIVLRPPSGGSFLVRGRYPFVLSICERPEQPKLVARYPGSLSVERADDGSLALTATLDFERYLEGIAEVPPSWPREALEAQAIAARSYALASTDWNGEEGQTLPTPICATSACQVYRGIPVPFDPAVRRWYAAVRRTAGEVLLFDGRPAETVYFSTSNGQTYGNDEVFGSPPLPYLRPVVERDDGASSVSHWSVRLPFDDLRRFLAAAGEWRERRSISRVHLDGSTVIVSGEGRSRSMDESTFRDAVNTWGPCLEPGRYPPASQPVTVPSRWMTLSNGPNGVVATGRGWGHGAGMVQWGAYGKARRGLSAEQNLAYYYGGLRPRSFPEPGLIHVQVASGLGSLRVTPSAPGARLGGEILGPGVVTITGGDRLTVNGDR